jgi:DNA-binding LacI/PurR family transcriptional regulator
VGAKNIHLLICKLCPITFTNRLAGAEAALNIAGAKAPKGGNVLYAEADDLNALKRYLKRQKSCPDAFICSNDAIAAVFRQTLEAAGLDVPQDVMLTGFADLQIASLMSPKLTTVHQNREMMAHMAFKRLMDRINDPSLPPCDFFLPSNLVARESTLSSKNFKRRKS